MTTIEHYRHCLRALIEAKTNAETDECYALNEGLHQQAIHTAFEDAKKLLEADLA